MTVQDLFDQIKPKTQDLDAFVYFDQEGLIYEPNFNTRLFVRDGAVRVPSITKVGDLSSLVRVTSIPEESRYAHYSFDHIPPEFSVGEVQESFVQAINALASYGSSLFYTASIECKNNQINLFCSGLQYMMYHKSACKMPDFRTNVKLKSWNIIYYWYQMLKENKVKKASYYTIDVAKPANYLYVWLKNDNVYARFDTDYENNSALFDVFSSSLKGDSIKNIGTFDRKYINDLEKNVKLKHLLKAFVGDIQVSKFDGRLHIFQDDCTRLYFL